MTDKEILIKGIKRAIQNGFPLKYPNLNDYIDWVIKNQSTGTLIFSHDFAKAFWGEKAEESYIMRYSDKIINEQGLSRWKFHLQQMVLEKEPLKYLEKFLLKNYKI